MTQTVVLTELFTEYISEKQLGYELIKPLPADNDLTESILLSAAQHLADVEQFVQFAWGDLLNIVVAETGKRNRNETIRNLKPVIAGMIPTSRQVSENTLQTWCNCAFRWKIERRHFWPVTWSHHYRLCTYPDAIQDEMVTWLLDDEHERVPGVNAMIDELVKRYPEYDKDTKNTLPPFGMTEAEIAEMDRDAMASELFHTQQELAEQKQELEAFKDGWQKSLDLLNKVVNGEIELPPIHQETWRPVIVEGNRLFIRDGENDEFVTDDPRVATYLRYWSLVNGKR